jgi:hypothetical protein
VAATDMSGPVVGTICTTAARFDELPLDACGIPARKVGPGDWCMGAHVLPFVVSFDEMFPTLRARRPGVYGWVSDFTGFDPTIDDRIAQHLSDQAVLET